MLALVCGSGDLPRAVAGALPDPPVICALAGHPPNGLSPEITFRIETLGSLIVWLKARGVDAVCFCGTIRRPDVDAGALDPATAPYAARIAEALRLGDDGALRVVLALFAEAGLRVMAAHEAAPALLPEPGVPTRAQPYEAAADDARLGDATLAEMGRADLGQACVVRGGAVIAREGPEGTDAMLAGLAGAAASDPFDWVYNRADGMLGAAADWLSGTDGPKGMLFKAPKPGQDRRVDLPVIGPDTAAAVIRAGLAGIVIEAGGVMVLEHAETVRSLDRAGRFLWVREAPG